VIFLPDIFSFFAVSAFSIENGHQAHKKDNNSMKFKNSHIYSSLKDAQLENDFKAINTSKQDLIYKADIISLSDANDLTEWLNDYDKAITTLADICTYAALERVVDSTNETAENLESRGQQAYSDFEQIAEPIFDKLSQLDDSNFIALVESDQLRPFKFKLEHQRALSVHRLTVNEETLLKQMSVDGLNAWGEQYSKLSGTLQCDIDGEQLGLASAFNLTMSADRTKREASYKAIQNAWREHENSVVAGLNAINGWRLNEFQRRSSKKEMHYLDVACHQSHITRDTLNALMGSAKDKKNIGQQAIGLMNRFNDIEDAKPWDLMAPPKAMGGDESNISYSAALNIIRDAFAEFDTEMADFVTLMDSNGWIDAQPTPNRATGAFCTEFFNAGEPRVFMTYEGTMGNVLTLAHEIGHAWHAWVLKDLAYSEKEYPMTLAETASIFAETLVRQSVLKNSTSDAQKREILWQEAETASALLINIPARFEFEKNFVEARKQGKVPAKQAKNLMRNAWETWYEGTLTEYDEMFWASKLHFSIAEIGFYNYPYLFGYLFALGVYAQKDIQGEQFKTAYRDLLKDTGRMTAEACIQKHLNRNIEDSEFWLDSLEIVQKSMDEFSDLIK
jgi:oligoendopeptidase F